MSPPPKQPPSNKRLDDPYLYGDAIPQPETLEKNTDTAWALFQELMDGQEGRLTQTTPGSVPAPQPNAPASPVAPGYAATAPSTLPANEANPAGAEPLGLDELMLEARRNNRVCPRLEDWVALYTMLPNKRQVDGKWEPPLPVAPQAWRITSAMVKRLCLRDHLEWAARHGAGPQVLAFLRTLPEDHWLHIE